MPNKKAINRIADFFNVSTDYLLGRTDNPLPNIVDLGDETLCPLVGQVVAGMPIEAQENLEGYIYISYKPADEYFALRVYGESMVGAGIPDGAIVVVPISRELEAELLARSGNRLFACRQDAVARNFRTVSAKLGFHVSAHILRHTYATRLEEAGVPAKVAQYLMGHATIQMTKDVYTDVQDSYIKTFDERVITFTDTRKRKD